MDGIWDLKFLYANTDVVFFFNLFEFICSKSEIFLKLCTFRSHSIPFILKVSTLDTLAYFKWIYIIFRPLPKAHTHKVDSLKVKWKYFEIK